VIALAFVMLALALAALWSTLAALRGQEPAWVSLTRHSIREAGYRWGGAALEFGDWLRLGR
jgi:hypothetical protein